MRISLLMISVGLTAMASAALAMPGDTPFSQRNKKEPVEVTSDQLEVFQEENRAVFSGHVVAIQGDMRLASDKMTIYYRKPDETKKPDGKKSAGKKPAAPAAPEASNAAPAKDAVKKIDVDGNVFLTTPQETASSATGTYDVENQMIYLNTNVILTRDKNTLKGDKLAYNLATGRSTMVGEGSSQEPQSQGRPRVRALFVPDNNKPEKPAKKP